MLNGDIWNVTESVGSLDNSDRTQGGAYLVTDNNYEVRTGSGDDTLVMEGDIFGKAVLGGGDDAVWGSEGRDLLYGGAGDDRLFGGQGDDSLYDIEGENTLYGGDGDDFILASSGSTIVGGNGADTFSLYLSTNVDNPLQVLDYDPGVDQLDGIRLHVADGDNYDLTAVAREDGAGTDLIFDGRVIAEVYGASVDDLAEVSFDIIVDGGTYTDDDTGHVIRSDYYQPETIFGGGGDDTIHGGPGDQLDAGDGNDIIFAHGQLSLGTSNPVDMSTVYGGSGDDIILSSDGNVMTGGDGADIFGLSSSHYSGGATSSGFDLTESIITDFDPAQDVIYLEGGFIQQAGGTPDDLATTLSIQVWSSGEGADILAGAEVIARVTGGQTLRVEDLVIAENGLGTELLGYH